MSLRGLSGNIVYVVNQYPPTSETFVADEIAAMSKRGLRVRVYALDGSATRGPGILRHGEVLARPPGTGALLRTGARELLHNPSRLTRGLIECATRTGWRVRPGASTFLSLLHAVNLGRLTRAEKGTVGFHLHAHFAGRAGEICRFMRSLYGLRYSVTVHAADIYPPASHERARAILGRASLVVAISEHAREHVLREGLLEDESRAALVRMGVDLAGMRPVRRRPKARARKLIVAVGRLVEKKGFRNLIEATARLAAWGTDVETAIIGEGPEEERLRRLAISLDCSRRIRLTGALSRLGVLEWLRRADLFVLPCLRAENGDQDGIPVALVEAMACGVPAVSTPVAGIPELVIHERTGLLVRSRDGNGIAAAALRILHDRRLARLLSVNGRKQVERRHDIDRQARRLEQAWRRRGLLNGRRDGGRRRASGPAARADVAFEAAV